MNFWCSLVTPVQTNPELSHEEVRRRIGEEVVEEEDVEEEEKNNHLGQPLEKGKESAERKKDKKSQNKEGVMMTRSSSSSKMSPCPTSPVYALTTSNLHYVDGRSDQQVCYKRHCHNGSVLNEITFHFHVICFRQSVWRIG